jgi:ABC-type maltose transport system permease subunit
MKKELFGLLQGLLVIMFAVTCVYTGGMHHYNTWASKQYQLTQVEINDN